MTKPPSPAALAFATDVLNAAPIPIIHAGEIMETFDKHTEELRAENERLKESNLHYADLIVKKHDALIKARDFILRENTCDGCGFPNYAATGDRSKQCTTCNGSGLHGEEWVGTNPHGKWGPIPDYQNSWDATMPLAMKYGISIIDRGVMNNYWCHNRNGWYEMQQPNEPTILPAICRLIVRMKGGQDK